MLPLIASVRLCETTLQTQCYIHLCNVNSSISTLKMIFSQPCHFNLCTLRATLGKRGDVRTCIIIIHHRPSIPAMPKSDNIGDMRAFFSLLVFHWHWPRFFFSVLSARRALGVLYMCVECGYSFGYYAIL